MTAVDRGSSGEIARWLISGVIVLAAHGGAAGVLAAWTESAPPGVPQAVVLLDLGSLAAAPPAPKTDDAPNEVESRQSDLVPDPVQKVEKEELEPPKPVVEQLPDPPIERPPEPPRKQAEVTLPPPLPPKPVEKKQKTASLDARRVHQDAVADRVTSAQAGALGVAKATYAQQIVAHLQRHKNYPPAARAGHIEGTVMLSFTLNRNGGVIASRIARGSGHSELDQGALDMLKRAQPFPTPPAALTDAQFPFTAPMRYHLD